MHGTPSKPSLSFSLPPPALDKAVAAGRRARSDCCMSGQVGKRPTRQLGCSPVSVPPCDMPTGQVIIPNMTGSPNRSLLLVLLLLTGTCGPTGPNTVEPGDARPPRDSTRDRNVADAVNGNLADALPDRSVLEDVARDSAPGPDPCAPIPGAAYGTVPTNGPTTDRPAPDHPDLNIKLRGWEEAPGTVLGLVSIPGPTDPNAPKLNTMFGDDRVPEFVRNYRVYDWDWNTDSRGGLNTTWEVTLSGFGTSAGEVIELPTANYDIGGGHQARVLYADEDSITLKYTAEDNVVSGYTIHIVGICVEPTLKALYDRLDRAGRAELPALSGHEPLGRARSSEVIVAIRDCGSFMDPRSEKDWW